MKYWVSLGDVSRVFVWEVQIRKSDVCPYIKFRKDEARCRICIRTYWSSNSSVQQDVSRTVVRRECELIYCVVLGCTQRRGCQAAKFKIERKEKRTYFMGAMTLNHLHDLHFSRNQPLTSADDWCIAVL